MSKFFNGLALSALVLAGPTNAEQGEENITTIDGTTLHCRITTTGEQTIEQAMRIITELDTSLYSTRPEGMTIGVVSIRLRRDGIKGDVGNEQGSISFTCTKKEEVQN